jgi:serine-type D-Ala-D-Ala carboxypeptidase/endopeptidase (penicillin-binding protein 4)
VRLCLAAVIAALAFLLPATAAHALGAGDVRARLAADFRHAGSYSGAYARDLTTGAELIAVRENTPRIPASVEKLFVTSAALLRLGPSGRLATQAVTDAEVRADGVLPGDLWLVGGGDPALDEAKLGRLADALRAAGVRRISGGIVADDSAFDRRRGGPRTGWRPDRDMGGRLGALVLGRGFQSSPAIHAARRFGVRLRTRGISTGRAARTGRAPSYTEELGAVASEPVAALSRRINVPSDNFTSEMLLKALGARFGSSGSTPAGAQVVRQTLDRFGVRPRIADGSGLSRANRTTPRQVVRLLERMEGQDVRASWRQSLAVPGRSGTVRRRMRGTPAAGRCRVKTGTIRAVSTLAGVCTTAAGRTVGFAWLMNGVNPRGARAIQDRMTATLARYSG